MKRKYEERIIDSIFDALSLLSGHDYTNPILFLNEEEPFIEIQIVNGRCHYLYSLFFKICPHIVHCFKSSGWIEEKFPESNPGQFHISEKGKQSFVKLNRP